MEQAIRGLIELNSFLFIIFSLVGFGISLGYLVQLRALLTRELGDSDISIPKISGASLGLFSGVSLLILLVASCQASTAPEQFILFSFYLLLWLIAFIDYHYRLISTFHCFLLLVVGLYLVQFQLLPIPFSLHQSLLSITVTLLSMGLVYLVYNSIFKRESFGFGDVVLASATATVLTWQVLAYYLLFACLAGLVIFGFAKDKTRLKQQGLPFAPFLNLSAGLVFNLQAYLVIVPSV